MNKRLSDWAEYIKDKRLNLMSEDELCYIDVPIPLNKEEEIFIQDTLINHGAIPLHELEIGKTYIGFCRNASEAIWQGDRFVYQRFKWGTTFPDTINHFQNDDGYDVFVPVRLKAITNKFDKSVADSITKTGNQLMEKLLSEEIDK
jgi:hypothetical protein